MNKISLTKVQEEKILEMCNDLFPDCKRVEISDMHMDNILFFFRNNGRTLHIHWFELCVMELPKRIAEASNTVYPKDKHAFIIDMMMKKMLDFSPLEKEHPVDYLYKMYQKTLESEE